MIMHANTDIAKNRLTISLPTTVFIVRKRRRQFYYLQLRDFVIELYLSWAFYFC